MAYSPKAKLAVIKMHQDGMSLREIEREFGIDRKDIRDWLYRYEQDGIEGLGRQKYNCTTYEDRCAAVKDYMENGMTYRDLSLKYGMSRGQLKILVSKFKTGGYDSLKEKPRGRPRKTAVNTPPDSPQN